MNSFLPNDFDCSDALRQTIKQKLAAFEAVADELPVFIIHDLRNSAVVYMSQLGLQLLGVSLEDIRQLGSEYYTKFFNAEDVAFYHHRFLELLDSPEPPKWFSFFNRSLPGGTGNLSGT